jgi:hypothetical protein
MSVFHDHPPNDRLQRTGCSRCSDPDAEPGRWAACACRIPSHLGAIRQTASARTVAAEPLFPRHGSSEWAHLPAARWSSQTISTADASMLVWSHAVICLVIRFASIGCPTVDADPPAAGVHIIRTERFSSLRARRVSRVGVARLRAGRRSWRRFASSHAHGISSCRSRIRLSMEQEALTNRMQRIPRKRCCSNPVITGAGSVIRDVSPALRDTFP